MEDNSVGEILKKEREKQGLSIEDIANTTRIRTKYIENIENDNYDEIGSTYVLGYIRSYALFLELDATKLVKQAQGNIKEDNIEYTNPQNYNMPFNKKTEVLSLLNVRKNKSSFGDNVKYKDIDSFEQETGKSSANKYIILIAIVVLIGSFIVVYTSNKKNTPHQEGEFSSLSSENTNQYNDESIQENSDFLADFKVQEQTTNEEQAKATKQTDNKAQEPVDNKDSLSSGYSWPKSIGQSVISFKFSGDSWIRVTNSNNKDTIYYDSIAKKDSVIEIPNVKEDLMFSVGNAKNVFILIEDKEYSFSKDSKRVVKNIPLNVSYIKENFK